MESCLVIQLLIPAAVLAIAATVQAQSDLSGTQFGVQCFLLFVAVASSPRLWYNVVDSLASLHLKFDPHL